jgi:hypothetical protein
MKGIYLTEEGKKEIEDKIAELEFKTEMIPDVDNRTKSRNPMNLHNLYCGELTSYKEILSSATILPVRYNWEQITILDQIDSSGTSNLIKIQYPNGVIIKPKE